MSVQVSESCNQSENVTNTIFDIQVQDFGAIYEGRPINKLQNGIILLIFKI